ncbi:hypothetical protein RB614_32030 [Phytohabitans sp. ZYX-F-186]|uniref:Chaplin domain-containing protein n=1 Tax=Phytohabitans maris TaxID=3071409 RepID=A0ABU0ZQ77_9ACTN|nr:hypothetical protein [Phytohabitans sp. ZYX-F-186]MDQ7909160.1 hypothetical protein [Phytohabitans sp. ZYX-F-186]
MRIKTIVGLSFAGAVAAVAVAGGVAYAADDSGSAGTTVKIVEDGSGAGGSAVDCPEKNGGEGSASAQENL